MGITINYTFFRRQAPEPLLKEVCVEALRRGMKIEERRVNHLILNPHPHSEWIELSWRTWKAIKEGDSEDWVKQMVEQYYAKLVNENDWICMGFTKTQFAGMECHREVAELLRQVAARCRLAEVSDEAGYYEGGKDSYEIAKERFDFVNKAISLMTGKLKAQFGKANVVCGQDLVQQDDKVP